MSTYNHLTRIERECIMLMQATGSTLTEIAKKLQRNKSTISRELRRNQSQDGYSACLAHECYQKRRRRCKKPKKLDCPILYQLVKDKIFSKQWSPEQISQRLKLEKKALSISFSTIYRGFQAGLFEQAGKKASRHLRHRGRTRSSVGKLEKRGQIAISNLLSERPKSAENRSRFGHWEADTVLGKVGGVCLLTLTDRKSRYLLVQRLNKKHAVAVRDGLINQLSGQPLRSITPDRGKEFAKHAEVTKALGVEFYFPEPHQPWQRGTNENTNGLLREYFPKRQDIGQWDKNDVRTAVEKINLRPRKCLGWRSAYEVYFQQTLQLI